MIQVLVKIGGNKKYRAKIHYYDATRNRALCAHPVSPDDPNWEIQERDVENFAQIGDACWHCRTILRQRQLSRPPTVLEQRHTADLAKLHRWVEWVDVPSEEEN